MASPDDAMAGDATHPRRRVGPAQRADAAGEIVLGSERFVLLPGRAALRVRTGELLVADLHLGKDEAFVRAGRALPLGETVQELARLDAVLRASGAKRLTILGDLTHHRFEQSSVTLGLLAEWLRDRARYRPTLVGGNHDRHAEEHLRCLPLRVVDEPARVEGIDYRHAPPEGTGGGTDEGDAPWVAGHVHPGFVLRNGHDRLRVPVFWLRAHRGLVLPAFGAFTGLFEVALGADDRAFAAGAEAVVELPRAR